MPKLMPAILAVAAMAMAPAFAQGGGGGQGAGQGAGMGAGQGMGQGAKMGAGQRDRDFDRDRLYLGAQDRLREHDRNGDGSLSQEEFRAWHESAFDAFDNDKSGGFTLQEYQSVRFGSGPKAGGLAKNMQRAQLRKAERFRVMDGDGDGVVNRNEYMNFGELNYLDADADDDGMLKFKELQQYHRNE